MTSAGMFRAIVEAVDVFLPATTERILQRERDVQLANASLKVGAGLVSRMTGVKQAYRMRDDWNASDLAVAAAKVTLERAGLTIADIDLLIFASASQDMVEPATSHIVAAKLGAVCPVMDVKNACNSVINAMEVADALIRTGAYGRVLIASGEGPTRAIRTSMADREQYVRSAPGLTMSDGGAAVILRAPDADDVAAGRGILASAFSASSHHWDVGTLPGGGTANPRATDKTYFDIDGTRLREAFLSLGPATVERALHEAGLTWDDVALVAVHQVAVQYLDDVHGALHLPLGKTILTVRDHGNLASVTLPLQLRMALDSGRLAPGEIAVLVGLAGGISIGCMVVRA